MSSSAWECLHTEAKSLGDIITAHLRKTEGFLWPPDDESSFCNILTSQVFPDAIYKNLIGAYHAGHRLYQDFVEDRLKPESKIFAQLKKAMVKTCKSSNKGVKIKHTDKVATLKEENIFISRIEMIRGSKDVDTKYHIGNHELVPVFHSLMRQK